MIEFVLGWLFEQLILHPVISFIFMLIAFAFYCWIVDWVGYHLIRKKAVSEALECSKCGETYTRLS